MSEHEPARRGRRALTVTARIVVAGGLLAWLTLSGWIDWGLLARVRFGAAFAGLLACRVACVVVPAVRWQRLASAEMELPVARALHISLIAAFVGIFVPSWVGQDGARMVWGARACPGRGPELASSILVDRLVGLVALLLVAAAGGAALALPGGNSRLGWLVILIAAAGGIVVAAAGIVAGVAPRLLQALPRGRALQRLAESAARYGGRRRVLAQALALSLVADAFVVAAAWLAFAAIGVRPPGLLVLAGTPLVGLAHAIPLTPMGLGIADAVSELFYRQAGLATGAEAELVVRLAALLVSMVCGLALLVPVTRTRAAG